MKQLQVLGILLLAAGLLGRAISSRLWERGREGIHRLCLGVRALVSETGPEHSRQAVRILLQLQYERWAERGCFFLDLLPTMFFQLCIW